MSEGRHYTAMEIASRIAERRGVDEGQIARVIRYLAREEIVAHKITGGEGRTAPKLWDEPGVHRIAILVELNRLGLSDDLVRAASFCMNNYVGYDDDGIGDPGVAAGRSRPDRLAMILPELKQGRAFYFHLYLIPDYFQRPGEVLGGTLSELSDGGSPHPFVCSTITVNLLPVLPLSNSKSAA